MKKHDSESGRAMFEMILVIIVMMIITYFGMTTRKEKIPDTMNEPPKTVQTKLEGYKYMINQTRTEETMHELKMRAADYQSQLAGGSLGIVDTMGTHTKLGYLISITMHGFDAFDITLSDIPQNVCTGLMTTAWDLPVSRKANGTVYAGDLAVCHPETNTITFSFVSR
ncbi:MAG: hypothetical protein LBU87_01215 [Lactobacillales bacterium]|nr:hypothetical protein [Lactobacillales bacterium]